jgi:hypothetical protein
MIEDSFQEDVELEQALADIDNPDSDNRATTTRDTICTEQELQLIY